MAKAGSCRLLGCAPPWLLKTPPGSACQGPASPQTGRLAQNCASNFAALTGGDRWRIVPPPRGARPRLSDSLTAAAPFLLAGLDAPFNAVPHIPGCFPQGLQRLAPVGGLVALIEPGDFPGLGSGALCSPLRTGGTACSRCFPRPAGSPGGQSPCFGPCRGPWRNRSR